MVASASPAALKTAGPKQSMIRQCSDIGHNGLFSLHLKRHQKPFDVKRAGGSSRKSRRRPDLQTLEGIAEAEICRETTVAERDRPSSLLIPGPGQIERRELRE